MALAVQRTTTTLVMASQAAGVAARAAIVELVMRSAVQAVRIETV